MAIRPLDDRILIKRLEAEEKTAGGIVLPDTAKEKPMKGEVVAVGEGKWDETGKEKPQRGKVVAVGQGRLLEDGKRFPPSVKPGDTVLFSKYAGTDIKIDGEEHTIMRESELLGVLED